VARFADEWNSTRIDLAGFKHKRAVLAEHCAAIERDPDTIASSLMIPMAIGRTSEDVGRRIAAARALFPSLPGDPAAWRAASFLAGSPADVIEALKEWEDAGMQRVLLQMLDQEDIAALELFAREVLPNLG
jgi:alkanesulfonate monooxygenase SsuD/methylene tetrahydromethanopterin reductase-like flavin-dependent oxidoreductase (luciferase family)